MFDIRRGNIFYIERAANTVGCEQAAGRPAIIVSNDKCNFNSSVVEVVFLTTQQKKDLPTHVDIRSSSKPSTALCEQINSVSVSRIGDYIGTCTDSEMYQIDIALKISLGLDAAQLMALPPEPMQEVLEIKEEPNVELIRTQAERDVYKRLYEQLLADARKG